MQSWSRLTVPSTSSLLWNIKPIKKQLVTPHKICASSAPVGTSQQGGSSRGSGLAKTIDDISHLAAIMASPGAIKASQQGGSFHVGISLLSPCPVNTRSYHQVFGGKQASLFSPNFGSQVGSIFSNSFLQSTYGG